MNAEGLGERTSLDVLAATAAATTTSTATPLAPNSFLPRGRQSTPTDSASSSSARIQPWSATIGRPIAVEQHHSSSATSSSSSYYSSSSSSILNSCGTASSSSSFPSHAAASPIVNSSATTASGSNSSRVPFEPIVCDGSSPPAGALPTSASTATTTTTTTTSSSSRVPFQAVNPNFPAVVRASSSASKQITPPPTKPRAKASKNSIAPSGLKHPIPGFVVGLSLPTMFGNYPPGTLKNIRKIKVNCSSVPIEMKNPRSELWFDNESLKKIFQQPNGFWATTGLKKFKALHRQIPLCLILQALELEDDAQALHDLAAIGNCCSAIGKEGLEASMDDCKDGCVKPAKSCQWKALQTSAGGAAIAANQGTSSQAVGTFDSEKRKEEFIVQSQSAAAVKSTKRHRSGDDPAASHRQVWDRKSKSAARTLQKTAKTLLQRTDQSQVAVTCGGFAETLTVQCNKIPKVSNLGGNWKKGEFTECVQIQARNQSDLEGLIDALKNITFGDNNKHNTDEYVQVHTWYADDKRSLPYEAEEARRSRDPRKKQRTESLGSESQNTATTDGSTIVMPSLCDEEEDEMDVDDEHCMWF